MLGLRGGYVLNDNRGHFVGELRVVRCGDLLDIDGCIDVDCVLIMRRRNLPG